MLDLLLGETSFLVLLVVLAVLLSAVGVGVLKLKQPTLKRPWIALAIAGPLVLVLWFVYNGLLELLGFAKVASVLAALALGIVPGIVLGIWIRGEGEVPRAEEELRSE